MGAGGSIEAKVLVENNEVKLALSKHGDAAAGSSGLQPAPAEMDDKQAAQDAEVLRLRELTREQFDASERAAASQAQRLQNAQSAPEQARAWHETETSNSAFYWQMHGGPAIEALLEHTPLIDLEYMIDIVSAGGVMPRRQDVPPSALINHVNVWRLKLWPSSFGLAVLVLSYMWLDWWHPDRHGSTLHSLLPIFRLMLAYSKTKSEHGTVGVFMDFPCLPQRPFATQALKDEFRTSLMHINEWYFHPFTHVLLVTVPPTIESEHTSTRACMHHCSSNPWGRHGCRHTHTESTMPPAAVTQMNLEGGVGSSGWRARS